LLGCVNFYLFYFVPLTFRHSSNVAVVYKESGSKNFVTTPIHVRLTTILLIVIVEINDDHC